MTGEVLRILLLVLQLAFVALLYVILFGFARSLLRDLRSAEQTRLAARTGIGRSRWARSIRWVETSTTPSLSRTTSSPRTMPC